MTKDLRFALRIISSHPWFSAAVVATLALGIGLNSMVFTLVNAALFKPVPLPGGERLVSIRNRKRSQNNGGIGVSYADFREYQAQASTLEALEAGAQERAVLSELGNPPQAYSMERASSGMFGMLHVGPVLGRGLLPEDDKPGAGAVILLGHSVWKARYGLSRDVVGRLVRVNGNAATIIGVMPEGFKFPENQDLWMALAPTPELENRTHRSLQLFGILKHGASITQAATDLEGIARRLAAENPEADKGVDVLVETFQERYNGGPIKRVFLLMLAAVGLVLLIVCANVANMMLSRALGRQREISIRAAMGASRWRLMRQLLIESLLLSALGGGLGLALSALGIHWFDLESRDVGKPYWVEFTMEYAVFGYFAAICLLSGLLFGLAPALRSTRFDLSGALKDGARSAGTRRGGKLSSVLVVLQFGLTLVLLTGAGLFVRGLVEAQSLNRWVPADRLLTALISLPQARYADVDSRRRFFEQLLTRVKSIPGVTHVAIASNLPGMGAAVRHIEVEHSALADPGHGPSASVVFQSPGYFGAISLPILSGRDFNDTDGAAGRPCAIVSREFAERHWSNQAAAGKRFRFYVDDKPSQWIAVIGVSADIVQRPDDAAPDPLVFVPWRQEGAGSVMLLVRSSLDPSSAASALRADVQGLDGDLPLLEVRTLSEAAERNRWYLRLFGKLFSAFALIALVIAAVGIYAVVAQATSSRTREIGVRMALGATQRNILGLVLARGFKQLLAGLALGLAAAFPAARLMTVLPFGVSRSDPLVFGAVSLLLAGVGLFASWLPARRAAALNPVSAIRYE